MNEELVREKMHRMYKGAKKEHTAQSLWRKYEQELTLLWTFAKKIPGIGNLAATCIENLLAFVDISIN